MYYVRTAYCLAHAAWKLEGYGTSTTKEASADFNSLRPSDAYMRQLN